MADFTPSLGDLLDVQSRANSGKARGPVPAAVISFDRVTQTASVRPLVYPKGGPELPVIPRVPVLFPGSKMMGMSIMWDLHEDDTVLLVPCENDISTWFSRQIDGEAPTKRKSDLADSVAIACFNTMQNPFEAFSYAAGAIVVRGSDVRLGDSTAAQYVALANLVLGELQAIKNAYDLHIHTTPAGPSGVPTVPMTPPASVACTRVKAL